MESIDNDVAAVGRLDVVPTILDTVCRLTGMRFAAIARVTDERWVACSVHDDIDFGLVPGGELKLETTICNEIRQSHQPVVISDVATSATYSGHHTPAMYGFRSYISMPILLPDGRFFGTICAIDPEPRDLERPETQQTFRMFAQLVGFHLDASERLARSEGRLASEIATGELREQFIAVLGHDLRNPLASVQAGVTMLRKPVQPDRSASILIQMQASIGRMARMIDDILDFARGQLGGGLALERQRVDVSALIRQLVHELASTHPDHSIVLHGCDGALWVECDPQRIGQMVSNILGNAFTHGAVDSPISIDCAIADGQLTIAVANAGTEIPAAARAKLFQPFVRGNAGSKREGLGLGLYIAAQIASAHGGDIALSSSPRETRFVATIPTEPDRASAQIVNA